MTNRRTTIAFSAAAAAALSLAACAAPRTDGQPAPTETVTIAPPSTTTSEPTIVDPGPTPSLTPRDMPPVLAFGTAFDYSDGITVNVSMGEPVTVPSYDGTVAEALPLTLTVTNNTSAPFDPSSADVTVSYGPDGISPETVFNMDLGWEGPYFTGTLLPGKTSTVTAGYEIPAEFAGDVVAEFTPDYLSYDRGAVFYTNNP